MRRLRFILTIGLAGIAWWALPGVDVRAVAADPAGSGSGAWRTDFAEAEEEAARNGLPLVVHFYADWCAPCRRMEREVLRSSQLAEELAGRFVAVKVDSDAHPDLVKRFRVRSLPSDVFVDPEGRVIARSTGFVDREGYRARLAGVEQRFAQAQKLQMAKGGASPEAAAVVERRTLPEEAAEAERLVPDPQDAEPEEADGEADRSRRPDDGDGTGSDAKVGWRPRARKEPAVGLDGYCPVSLWTWREWRKGKPQFAAEHQGIRFHMATADELASFRAFPGRYAPRLLGCDPVVLWETDRAIPGSTKFAAYFDGELYLFVDAESRSRFREAPERYTKTRHVLKGGPLERMRLR